MLDYDTTVAGKVKIQTSLCIFTLLMKPEFDNILTHLKTQNKINR